jgi:two-component system CheB/CheR fusion protein
MGARANRRGKKEAQPSAPSVAAHEVEAADALEGGPLFSVVGIGASAGGLEAFTQLLRALPVDTGMAFVLVQHLSPNHVSALAEILSRATRMPVAEVIDELALEPNHVYVIPPDRDMLIAYTRLRLLPRSREGRQHPIDHFFRSLATQQRHMAIGVVLSGTASDGTLGLEEIKAEGGITFAQDESAQQHGMPYSAVASGCVDFVLSPEGIAAEIGRIGKHPYVAPPPRGRVRSGDRRESAHTKESLTPILDLLRSATNVDFTQYKVNTLQRRIGRRMVLQHQEGLEAYASSLRKSPGEAEALCQDILISVTSFFRDPEVFESLKHERIPALLTERSHHDPVRAWVVGCSTGEEAYSLAMILVEALEASGGQFTAQVFATDLNAAGIERARAGVYSRERLQDVSRERLRRFFVEQNGEFRVSKPLRDMCVFSRHNVLADPPFSRMDIVTCRNLLIYLEPEPQQRILPVLHYALKQRGLLVLGASESVGRFGELFAEGEGKLKIFAKKPGSGRVPPMPNFSRRGALLSDGQVAAAQTLASLVGVPRMSAGAGSDVHRAADRLLAGFAPPAVLVDSNLEILQFRGDTEPFLVPAQGRASLLLLRMVRPELLQPLQALLLRARKENVAVREAGLRMRAGGEERGLDLEVLPVRGGILHEGYLLVLFKDPSPDGEPLERAQPERVPAAPETSAANAARLEHELASAREHLQTVMEQFESANEELQSSNEETQSTNEELQSINEELETSKEEIQSSNEELTTVNDELRSRNTELGRLNSDLTNLISSVQMAVVIVGRDLRIRRFSPLAEKLLNLIPTDVGRPITDIRTKLIIPELDPLLIAAIDTVTPQERDVQSGDGHWYSVRVRPYLTAENKVDGAVLSLVDIDAIRRARDHAETIVATLREPLLVLDADLHVQSAGSAFYDTFRLGREAVVGRAFFELDGGKWDIPELRGLLEELLLHGTAFEGLQVAREFASIGARTLVLNARKLRLPGAERPSILLAFEDVTDHNRATTALQVSETRYRRLFESAQDGILILDAKSARISDANPFLDDLLGYTHAELLGKELWQIGLFKDAEASKAAVEELQQKRYIRYEDLPLRTKTGQKIDVEFVSNVYTEGEHSVIQCNIRDISQRKKLEADLAKRNTELASADVAKNNFIAVLSHELRSPLNIINLWTKIIQRPRVDEGTLRKGVDIIQSSVQAQSQLIEDLLDVHRITAGKLRLEFDQLDLAAIVRSTVETMLPEVREKGIRVRNRIEPKPLHILGDPARLQQVLRNLLGNAVKFTPRGGEIRVSLKRSGARAELRVRDTGEGISAQMLPLIFDRFRMAEPLASHAHGGLGLGLAIARQLVELHGGTIGAESAGKGVGATFTISLPLVARSKVLRRRRAPAKGAPVHEERSLAGVTVLAVDDEADAREALQHLLDGVGATTIVAGSTDEALVSFKKRRPDVIVSDIGMRGRDGYELLRAIRALPAGKGGGVPAIALTAYSTLEDRDRAMGAGFQLHLSKPVESARLIGAVAALVSGSAATSAGAQQRRAKKISRR